MSSQPVYPIVWHAEESVYVVTRRPRRRWTQREVVFRSRTLLAAELWVTRRAR